MAKQRKSLKPRVAEAPSPDNGPDKEDDLWRRVAGTVKPLKGRVRPLPLDGPGGHGTARQAAARAKPAKPKGAAPARKAPLPELSHDKHPGLDKRTARRLRQGKLGIEGRLDLHGLTQVKAHHKLTRYIDDAGLAGKRMVIVITGKGLRPDGRVGVLREAVPRWLNESPTRDRIIGFSHAAPKDGGEGALYVRLKKRA